MKIVRDFFRRLFPPRPERRVPKFRRKITIVGYTPAVARRFTSMLLDSIVDGVRPLSFDDESAHVIRRWQDGETPVDGPSTLAILFDPPRRRGRGYHWKLFLPANTHVTDDAGEWKSESGICIICWPYEAIGRDNEETRDLMARLRGMIGNASKLGRLRLVMVAVTDVPEDSAPRDESQAWLRISRSDEFQAGLRQRLEASYGVAGDPLVDPDWREALEALSRRGRPFLEFVENIRRSLNADCPIWFGSSRSEHVGSVLDWIHVRGKQPTTGLTRTARRLAWAAAACGVLCLSLLGLSPGPRRLPSVAAVDSVTSELEWRDRGYGRFLGLPRLLVGSASAETSIVKALDRIRSYRTIDSSAQALADTIAWYAAGADTLGTIARSRRGAALEEVVDRSLGQYLGATATPGKFPTESGRRWALEIARGSVTAAFLRLEPRNDGFDGFALDTTVSANTRAILEAVGVPALSAMLAEMTSSESAVGFYRRVLLARRSAHASVFAIVAAPKLRLESAFLEPSDQIGADRIERRLREVCGLAAGEFSEFVVRVPGACDESEHRLKALKAPRPMTLRFTKPGDRQWHLDVWDAARGTYRPAEWREGVDGCAILLKEGSPGMQLLMVLNPRYQDHVQPRNTPCPGESLTIVLSSPTGVASFSDFDISWSVDSGWIQGQSPRP